MTEIRFMRSDDKEFWYRLDRHLPEAEFENKVREKRGYVISGDGRPFGLLRYNLFWDNTPFCTMLYLEAAYRRKGFGTLLMRHWEDEMRTQGYGMLLVSTQTDESAQHFYRRIGYRDCGGLLIDVPGYEQPMELFLSKDIRTR